MRKDYQKFICDHCGRTFVRNKDGIEHNINELKIFAITDKNDVTKEYCNEECMLKALPDIMIKDETLGRRIDLRLESYKYEYEY